MRGKVQLIYLGQPFIFEKSKIHHADGERKIWRCNQWWSQKCRARVYTVGNQIKPLNKFHTHEDIVQRKQRITKKDKMLLDKANYIVMKDEMDMKPGTLIFNQI